jgi:putative PIN family toxin of toxin-antitoxin system
VIIAVLDTNVLASGFIGERKSDSTPGELVRRWRAKAFALIVSDHILLELTETFSAPCFTSRLTSSEIAAALDSLMIDATIQPITVEVSGVATHPEDDLVLAAALSAGAPFLVTGDRQLRARGIYRGTQCLSPRDFLRLLDRMPER